MKEIQIWQEPWFIFLVAATVAILLFAMNRYHISKTLKRIKSREKIRIEEIEKIRKLLAQDFHDEMGNKLASITVLSSSLDLLIINKSRDVKEILANLEGTAKELFNGTKSFIWSMDPQSDNLREIITYINHFGTQLYDTSNIKFQLKSPENGSIDNIKLPMGASRQLFFIYKEAMTNTLVHSGARDVVLSCRVNPNNHSFEIELSDDGCGLDINIKPGKGLHNMEERAKKFSYQFTLNNNQNGGLSVIVVGQIPTL